MERAGQIGTILFPPRSLLDMLSKVSENILLRDHAHRNRRTPIDFLLLRVQPILALIAKSPQNIRLWGISPVRAIPQPLDAEHGSRLGNSRHQVITLGPLRSHACGFVFIRGSPHAAGAQLQAWSLPSCPT